VRTLLLCSRPPWPRRGGDRVRTFALARGLAGLGPIAIVALVPAGEAPEAVKAGLPFVERWWLPTARRGPATLRSAAAVAGRRPLQQALYDAPVARAAVAEAIATFEPDVIVAHLVRTVPWLPASGPPVVIDVQDALSEQYRQSRARARGWRRLAFAVERRRIGEAEQAALRRADLVSYITPRDRRLVDPEGSTPSVITRAVIDVERFAAVPRAPEPGVIGFMGNLHTGPNRDMAIHFARRVLPLVRSARPEATLHLFGIDAPPDVRGLARLPGVHFVGPVDDAATTLARCALTVCPQRFGSGVQNKVLESLAVGTPAVVTPTVAEALGPEAAAAVAQGELDRGFAMRVVELLANPEQAARLGEAGRRFVAAVHAPDVAHAELFARVSRLTAAAP